MEFRGYKYSINTSKKEISILSKEDAYIPATAGKFIPVLAPQVNSLTHGKIYATEIEKLNDIFEGVHLVKITHELIRKKKTNPTEDDYNACTGLTIAKYGIISLCNSPSNAVMWGLYTNHKGFYVEFDSEAFYNSLCEGNDSITFSNITPIRYEEDVEHFYSDLKNIENPEIAELATLHTKVKSWLWEKEYRILASNFPNSYDYKDIFKTNGYHFHYPPQACISREMSFDIKSIKRLILGRRFFNPESTSGKEDDTYFFKISTLDNDNTHSPRKQLLKFAIEENIPIYSSEINPITLQIYFKRISVEMIEFGNQITIKYL